MLGETDVVVQGLLVFGAGVAADVNVNDVELAADRLRHPGTTRDQILRSGIRADADRDALANRGSLFDSFFREVCVQAAVHHVGYLPEREFTKGDQVAGT